MLHELPRTAADAILSEAYRILAPGGTLGIMEMDPSSPGYIKLMSNPFFFSILRSTEPYLGDYFGEVRSGGGATRRDRRYFPSLTVCIFMLPQVAPALPQMLKDVGFAVVRQGAATGRHMALVAVKGGAGDFRPGADERARSDMHLPTAQRTVR